MPHDIQLRVLPHPSTGLDLALDIFITAKEAERCTPRTIQTYGWTLRRFLDRLQEQKVRPNDPLIGLVSVLPMPAKGRRRRVGDFRGSSVAGSRKEG
jgi:hypothetical protein